MNFGGRGFPFPQDNEIGQNRDSWTPVTPGKPIPQRSDMIPVDMQGNHVGRENWNDLLGVYSDILEAPDLNVAAGHISNPSGPMGTKGGNRNSNLVLSQNGGVRNGNLVLSQNGGIQNFDVVFGQNGGGVRNGNVGTGQNEEVRNVNVGMGHNGGVRNVSLGMGHDGGVQNMHAGMVPNGGNQSRNVGAGQNAQIHDWNVGLGQNEGNRNLNMGTGRIGGNRNLNMATSQNGGTHNLNVGMGQTGVNRNWKVVQSQNGGNKTQGIPSQNGYSSSYTTRNLPNDPSNWSPGLMAALLKAKNQAAASGEGRNRAMQTSFQVQSRPVIPRSEFSSSVLREQDQTFSSSQEVREYNLQQLPIDGFPDTYRPTYNLNSPPRAEAEATSSVANFFQLEPVTPDMRKLQENHNVPQEVNCSVYGSSSQEKDGILTNENNENQCNELLQSIVNSSSSAVSTTPILDAFEEGHERGIDLNKTPQQKTPKKKKHRPKVVREGKPKKTPKPKAPEKGVPNETPSGKRKYARKNGLKISESQQPNDVGQVCAESPQCVTKRKYVRKNSLKTPESQQESAVDYVKVPAAESTTKSCRRALSFDLESTQNDENQVERNQGSVVGFNLNINPQDAEMCTGINSISKASAVQLEGHNGYIAGPKDQQTSTCQMLLGNSSSPEATAPTTPLPKMKAHNLNAIARNVTMRNSIPGQNAQLNGYSQVDRHASGGLGQTAFYTDAGCTDLERGREQMLQRTSQMFMEDIPSVDGKRGLKRQSFEQINPRTINNMHPPFMYQKMLREAIGSSNGSDHFDSSYLESNKKKKMQDGVYSNISTAPSGIMAVNDSPRQERRGINGVQANRSVSQLLNTYFRGEKATETNAVNLATGNSFFHPMSANQNLQKHHVGSELQSCAERLAMKKSQELNRVHDFNPLTAIVACNQLPTTPPKDPARSDYLQEMMARNAYLLKQQQTLKQSSSNRWLHVSDQILQQEYNNAVEGRRHLPTAPKETPRSDYLQDIRSSQANVLEQKQCQNPGSGNRKGIDKMLQQQQKYVAEGHQQSSTKARGMPTKQYYLGLVDEITYRLEGLNIGGDRKHQHALVPYNADNSIILFEPKKRKPRPRVDLDPETDRLWKLLMGKEGCGGAEAMDKDKEKWWEEERAVFRGRADSFIARMHLVQGDRRFSRWKGSVVDSVIGVFLTQNVSDHLSSSAFMSLAAKFPPNPTATNEAYCQSGIQVVVEEPDIQILEQNGSIKYNEEIGRQPQYNHNLMIACESTENKRHLSSGVSDAVNKHNRLTEEELVSQDSFDSLVFQTADEQRSSSGSNSEAEDQTTGSKPINPGSTLMNLLNPERGNLIEEFYNHMNGSTMLEERTTNMRCQLENQECDRQNLRYVGGNNLKSSPAFSSSINSNIHHMRELVDSPNPFQLRMKPDSQKLGVHFGAMSAEETLSSLPSTASGVTDAYHTNNRTYHQSEMQTPRAQTFVKYGYLSKHPTHQGAFQPGHQIGSVPNSMNNQQPQNSNTHQVERAFMRGPIDPAETLTKMESARKQGFINPKFRGANVNTEDRMSVVDKQNCIENTAVEANSKEQTCSSRDPLGGTATNNVNTKKGKAEDEKKGAFDWDSLRKQVLLNGGKKERSKDAVDSLNYEALRTTDVKNISDAIRERGMNNMLADRIQDFLNRLVRDHESIDLEWLRDVPPDRAKDYLLSFRGLGLKSVECVRLLTLHHLAFPVDTNVGRIAVRLGWVPLQPLPESLQLHLLEMYPVLESIQKYLWPRLCKLDQPTLYELHYQMITFGKVFCTKSKPNCNACPMRAECRHFASAFASARFALPGPEEKRMVSSAIPIVDDIKPKEAIMPLSLPPAENSSHKDSGFFDRKCVSIIEEPIIEYPSSPHSETTEISERDIEDAFYEDPDEIPTIRLNMEEFTTNLQNLMQDNMELQGDMSKALVALNPEAASIPTAKLKNVSRLRTEHRVYELPDSHPLLDGLDKREPDDPSPYLLAIWTPGETANSVQPPESTCSAQESGNLCDDNTCFSCNSTREANSQTVRGTILVPCRTAMRGSFPLNGTYFQVNEMFADHESSLRPIDVPRTWLWNLPRRTVFFGTSVSTIFKGLTTEEIQFCFWRGFVCVRGFDQKSRAPRPLMARLHFPASKLVKKKDEKK